MKYFVSYRQALRRFSTMYSQCKKYKNSDESLKKKERKKEKHKSKTQNGDNIDEGRLIK